jgi:hypothetical protein
LAQRELSIGLPSRPVPIPEEISMSTAQQILDAMRKRAAFLVVFGLAAALAACGGGSGTPVAAAAPVAAATPGSLSGTAAKGAALGGVTVTVKDSTGKVATATTSATGSYAVNTSGMTAPLLVQATLASGTKLYSVTADGSATTVANITPLTDLIIRSWYDVQGVSVDNAFASPTAAPPPTPVQVQTIAQTVLQVMQLALNTYSVSVTNGVDLISQPFVADHTGIDKVLDNTQLTVGTSVTLVATAGSSTQTTVISYNTATLSLTANTTTVNGTSTSTSSVSTLVPVSSAQSQALQDINASLASFASVINSKGTALTATDVISFADPDLLNEGLNRTQFATSMVKQFSQGQTVGFAVLQINSLDTTAGLAEAVFRVTETLGTQSGTEIVTFAFKKTGSTWLLYGDRRLAKISLQAEARQNQGRNATGSGPDINIDVQPPQNLVTAVAAASSATGNAPLTKQLQAVVDDSGLLLDHFFFNTGALTPPLPAVGTLFTLTLSKAAGGTAAYTVPLNAFTTELIQVTNPIGVTLADAHVGGALPVSWTLPSTYAISKVKANAIVQTANFQCNVEPPNVLAITATSTTLTMPATCNGEAITSVDINLSVQGVNGERSFVLYLMN